MRWWRENKSNRCWTVRSGYALPPVPAAGRSTLKNALFCLDKPNHLRGYETSSVAQKILSSAIISLSEYVDCLSIVSLPEQYRRALTATNLTFGFFLSELFTTKTDPISQLLRIDSILVASNVKLVIMLEDLDRNISDTMLRDEIPSLLDKLRQLNNVSFVLAIGSEQHYSDILIRICNHIEMIA